MARGCLTVLHTSDYQCGRPFLPEAADAMVRLAEAVRPDVVVAAGDLTQRAKAREFALARSVLDRFGAVPIVVTPGNHDVPLYRFWARSASPYWSWRRFAGPKLDTVTRVPGATFVALNSSAPRRAIVNGRVDDDQLAFAREVFAQSPGSDLRIVVIHHHFVPTPDGRGGHPLPRAARIAGALEAMGVDAVLGGHVHRLHIRTSRDVPGASTGSRREAMPIIACGTTTSRRGRGEEIGSNSLCLLRFEDRRLVVTPYLRSPTARDFEPLEPRSFDLTDRSTPASSSAHTVQESVR